METKKNRRYILDGDTITVDRIFDQELGLYRNDYPDFDKNPRITPTGKRWVNVYKEDCGYSTGEYGDCGSCQHFKSENEGDLIGICENEQLRLKVTENENLKSERKEA